MKAFRLITPLNLDLVALLEVYCNIFLKIYVTILCSLPTRFKKLGTGASLSLSIPTRFQKLGTGASLSISMPTQYRQMTEEFFLTFYSYKTSQKAIN